MTIDIIIPWRDAGDTDRVLAANWAITRYQSLFPPPTTNIFLADAPTETFSRGASINLGVHNSKADYIIIVDADYVFSQEMADQIINDSSWTIAVKTGNYFYLDSFTTKHMLKENPISFTFPNFKLKNYMTSQKCPFIIYGGLMALPRKNFIRFDENLIGYGYEDNIWYMCMEAMYGQPFKTNLRMYHLDHIRVNANGYMQKSFDNLSYYSKVWEPLKGNSEAIIKLIKEKGLIDDNTEENNICLVREES